MENRQSMVLAHGRHSRTGVSDSDIAYRIPRFAVVSVHGFGAWIQCTGMAITRRSRRQCPMKSAEILLSCTAIALQSIHLFQSLRSESLHFFAYPSLPVYNTPGRYRIDMGVFLAPWQWA